MDRSCSNHGALRLCGIVLVSTLLAFIATQRAMAAPAGDPVETGRARARVVLFLRSPGGCVMPLFNARCRSEVDEFFAGQTDADFRKIPKVGPHPLTGLQAFLRDGARESFDSALGYLNTVAATPSEWSSSAASAALVDGGIMSVSWPTTMGNPLLQLFSIEAMVDLDEHRALIPPGTFPVDLPKVGFQEAGRPGAKPSSKSSSGDDLAETTRFVAEFESAHEWPALPPASYPEGLRGDALLGSSFSAVVQLTDLPEWLVQPDSQQFVDATVARLQLVSGDPGRAAACRKMLLPGSLEWIKTLHSASLQCTGAFTEFMRSLPQERQQAFLAGAFASQLALNAAYFRNVKTATMLVQVLSRIDALDSLLPAFAKARATLSGAAPSDWTTQFHAGLDMSAAIAAGDGS